MMDYTFYLRHEITGAVTKVYSTYVLRRMFRDGWHLIDVYEYRRAVSLRKVMSDTQAVRHG